MQTSTAFPTNAELDALAMQVDEQLNRLQIVATSAVSNLRSVEGHVQQVPAAPVVAGHSTYAVHAEAQ